MPAVNCAVRLYPVNGAAHDVAPGATAWGHRDAKNATVIAGMWPDPADNDKGIRSVKDYYAALAPHSQPGGYVNFASADDQAKVRDNFGLATRLAQSNAATTQPTSPPQPEHHPRLAQPPPIVGGFPRDARAWRACPRPHSPYRPVTAKRGPVTGPGQFVRAAVGERDPDRRPGL